MSPQQTVAGVVLNAVTGLPIARALVQVGEQAVLTEHDGQFAFAVASGTSAMLRVSKPGYYGAVDQSFATKRVSFNAGADLAKVYLFPEGLITGAVTAPNGDPVSGVLVQALRRTGDDSGSSWAVAGQCISNADGEFRLPLSAGDYVVETHYLPGQPSRQYAILPAMMPDPGSGSSSSGSLTLHLHSGSEQHFALRPQLRTTHDVHVRVDGTYTQDFLQIEAHLPNGLSFFPASRPTGTSGEYLVTMPTGSYLLTVTTGGRDGGSYAEAAATIGENETVSLVMQTTRTLTIAVEVLADSPSATTSDNTPPAVQQLGLRFVRTDRGAPAATETTYPHSSHAGAATFSLVPGRYRLLSQQLTHWYLESASVGGTDLLAQELDVEAGEISAPLRVVASSNTAAIKGKVNADGMPAANYLVYLIAAPPGVTPVISTISGNDGTFSQPSIPPGNYRAVALENRRSGDFTDPVTLEHLAPYTKSFSVGPGEVGNMELDAVPTLELPN